VVAGSEGRTGQTQASQLLDGGEWATREHARQGSDYFGGDRAAQGKGEVTALNIC